MAGLEQPHWFGKMGEMYPTGAPGIAPSVARLIVPQTERDPDAGRRSHGMDGIRELLEAARDHGLAAGHLRGLLHVAIGRKVSRPDGTVVSAGLTWREVAGWLKLLRFDRELVREFGADPEALAPRDRERFWYSAIAQARVDSREAVAEAEALVGPLKKLGFVVGPSPSALPAPKPTPPAPKGKAKDEPAPKRKKK